MRRKGILITLLFLWIYLVGMGILLYPAINNYYTSKRMEGSVESFYGSGPTESDTGSTEATQTIRETEPPTPYPELLEMLEAYNRELYEDDQSKLNSLAATEQPGVLFSTSGQKGDVFGVLSIAKLEMEKNSRCGVKSETAVLFPRQFQPGVLHLQHKMAFVEFQQSLITHFTEFNGQSAALDGEIVSELLTGKRNIKFIGSAFLRLSGEIGHNLCSCCPLPHMRNLFAEQQIFACQLS